MSLLAEQVRQQGDELHTDQGHAAAGHELFHALALYLCMVKKHLKTKKICLSKTADSALLRQTL